MKFYKIILLIAAGLLVFAACEDSTGPVISDDAQPPAISAPSSGENYTLTEDDAEQDLFTLQWSAPDFGFPAAISYRVQLDPHGTDFDNPINLGDVSTTSFTISVGSLNSRLISAGLPGGVENPVAIRVRATLSDQVDPLYSEPLVLNITPYVVEVSIPEIYVPGGYQSASGYTNDWSPADAPALYSFDDNEVYEGYVYFHSDNSEYKFTVARNWDEGDWGGSGGTLEPGGPNIIMQDAGYYRIIADIGALSYTVERTEWGIIGEAAIDWDNDVMMEYDIEDKVWRATTDLSAGEMKFRANADWALNYGDDGGDGTLQRDGPNIVVEESGNYTVELDLSGPTFSYTLIQN